MSQIVWVEPKPAKPVQNGLKQPKRAKKSQKEPKRAKKSFKLIMNIFWVKSKLAKPGQNNHKISKTHYDQLQIFLGITIRQVFTRRFSC